MAELDPTRPYTAGSPWSAGTSAHPNDPRHASVHIWDVWNGEDDYPKYRRYRPRFVAEFGFQGLSGLGDAPASCPRRTPHPGEPGHAGPREVCRRPGQVGALGWSAPPGSRLYRGLALGNLAESGPGRLLWHRLGGARSPRGAKGTVIWQLNDCWPVISWAAVDGDGRRKPLWYAVRRSYADCLLTVQPEGEGLVAAMVNDGLSTWSAGVVVARQDFWGAVLARATFRAEVAPGSVGR